MFRLWLLLRLALVLVLAAAVLFGSAGRLDLPFFWAYLAVFAFFGGVTLLTVSRGLLEERFAPKDGGRDNLRLLRGLAALVFLSEIVVAGLDVGRFHGSDTVPAGLQVVALGCSGIVLAVWYWAMQTNPFFSAAVRVQHDRGHYVVTSGPYRFVRHPGYAAFVLFGWGGPLSLGSWLAVLPHAVIVVLFVRRALLEDRVLMAELDGYSAYAGTVRFRFVPGIW